MLATHQEAERRYDGIRRVALSAAQRAAPSGLRYDLLTPAALNAAVTWASASDRLVTWDWFTGYSAFKFRYPKRFELALWEHSGLIALSLGRPTYNGGNLRLDFVEARPKELGNRTALMAHILMAYGVYARLLDAKEVRIMHPINDEVRDYYAAFGYTYLASKDYLFKQVLT
jgi:hypothetical protein